VSILSALYGHVALRRRHRAARTTRPCLRRPVISIGNLSVGGSGKTPLVAHVARLLLEAGHRPAVLSRGYARTDPQDGVVIVSDGERVRADVGAAGDEPLMLARQLPGAAVLVCPDRYLAGRLAEHRLECTVHLLDDGFQHLALARTADLLIVTEDDLGDCPLPAGRLREPLEAASAADAVLWTGEGEIEPVLTRLGVGVGFRVRRVPGPICDDEFDAGLPEPGARVVAVAGIAKPAPFVRQLRDEGYDVAGELLFRDHHPYTRADVARMAEVVARSRAGGVVTTEKDMIRLLACRPLPFALAWRGLSAHVEPARAFRSWLLEMLQHQPHDGSGAPTA
jgi:tetraacyldisaccharide 4'-kinase